MKTYLVWYIKINNWPNYLRSAKMQQMTDWVNNSKPFGDIETVLIPSDENKVIMFKHDGSNIDNEIIENTKNKLFVYCEELK